MISLFSSISNGVRELFYLPELDEQTRQYGRVIASVMPGMKDAAKLLNEPSQHEKILSLRNAISAIPRQIVVVLDDLDRMQAAELEVLLKVLKGGPELPNVTFLCALDKMETSLILKSTRPKQNTLTFLEKFFTVEISIPNVDRTQLWLYFLREFESLLSRELQ